ncbi:hypothetical protein OF83DRAFT_1094939 [Amylostereum chailletii]|nr:hypothetical protein OF83DRAFT_1094939 [Amylostereum chailletii]
MKITMFVRACSLQNCQVGTLYASPRPMTIGSAFCSLRAHHSTHLLPTHRIRCRRTLHPSHNSGSFVHSPWRTNHGPSARFPGAVAA